MRRSVGLLAMMTVATGALAAEAAVFEFQGVVAGSDVDPKSLRNCEGGRERSCVKVGVIVAGERADTVIRYYDNRLSSVYAQFDRENYGQVAGALRSKYGEPCKDSTEEWRNAMGTSLDNRILTWCFATGELELREIGSKLSKTVFMYQDEHRAPPAAPVVDF